MCYSRHALARQETTLDPTEHRLQQYRALFQVSESIAVSRNLPDLIRDLSIRLDNIVPFDYINLVLHEPARNVMRVVVLKTPLPNNVPIGFEMPVDESPAAGRRVSENAVISARPPKSQLLRRRRLRCSACKLRNFQDNDFGTRTAITQANA